MPHQYFDTSDLNAPYDQCRSARPLQGLGTSQHLYMDYSDLNAQWDRDRPAIHGLGGGSLGGSSLGNAMSSTTGLGLASIDEGCAAVTSAHGRMYRGLVAMSGDEELMAQFEANTARYGCPVRGANHWFWPNAPTGAWGFRGNTEKFVEDDWLQANQDQWTLYIPPFVQDMGESYTASVQERTTVALPEVTVEVDPSSSPSEPEVTPVPEESVPTEPNWVGGLVFIGVAVVAATALAGGMYYFGSRSA